MYVIISYPTSNALVHFFLDELNALALTSMPCLNIHKKLKLFHLMIVKCVCNLLQEANWSSDNHVHNKIRAGTHRILWSTL